MINAIQIALSGLAAASKKVEAGASNIANMATAGSLDDPDNAPYTPLTVQQKTLAGGDGGMGVQAEFTPKNPPFVPAYDPDSPFANEEGVIGLPNVDLAEEAVNLNLAEYAYKASLRIIQKASEMQEDLLRAFDKKA